MPILLSIQTGSVNRVAPSPGETPPGHAWLTAFFKQPRTGPVALHPPGLEGDAQADRENHGGLDKAVCVYPSAHHSHWRSVLGWETVPCGAFGENFTVEGVDESGICVGDVLEIGSSRVEVSQPRQPCWKLARRWGVKDLAARVERTGFTGWYLRVLQPGLVTAGQAFRLMDRPHPEWTIARVHAVMHHRKGDRSAAAALAACPALSEAWRTVLRHRAEAAG